MKKLILLPAVLGLSACATITTGTTQQITVETPYAIGSSCDLKDSAGGSYYIKSTPDSAMVNKGDGPLTVKCEKAGYNDGVTVVEEKFQGATLGNIILGGGIGVIVDAASGAAQEYPKQTKVFLEKKNWKSDAERQQWLDEKLQYERIIAEKDKPANPNNNPRNRR